MTSAAQKKLYILHAILRGHIIDGQVEAMGKVVTFNFIPGKVSLAQQALTLNGRMNFAIPKQSNKIIDGVSATLMATQGGVGVSPVRRQLLTGTAQTAQTATSDQKLEQEKGPETDIQPGLHSFEPAKYDELGRPRIESTDALSFVGVLYFKLSPIDSGALGIKLDMSDIQLGLRLAPTDDLARDIQMLFTDAVMSLESKSQSGLDNAIEALNSAFSL